VTDEYEALREIARRQRAEEQALQDAKRPPAKFPCPRGPRRFPSAAARDRHAEMRHAVYDPPPEQRSARLRALRTLLTGRD
jgi:hypothetical protein